MKALTTMALASLAVTVSAAGHAHGQKLLPAKDPANQVKLTPADMLPLGLAITRFDALRTGSQSGPDFIRVMMAISNRSPTAVSGVTWSISTRSGLDWKELASGPSRSLAGKESGRPAMVRFPVNSRSPHPMRLRLVVRGKGSLDASKEITVP